MSSLIFIKLVLDLLSVNEIVEYVTFFKQHHLFFVVTFASFFKLECCLLTLFNGLCQFSLKVPNVITLRIIHTMHLLEHVMELFSVHMMKLINVISLFFESFDLFTFYLSCFSNEFSIVRELGFHLFNVGDNVVILESHFLQFCFLFSVLLIQILVSL